MGLKLKNCNISIDDKISFVVADNYIYCHMKKDVYNLRQMVKQELKSNKGVVCNKATGYSAKITNATIYKILFPSPRFNPFNYNYIVNLNASLFLLKLFEKAVYVDTLKPMKGKENNTSELGYHHFVSPLFMNNKYYRVLITVREKINSKVLYIVSAKLFDFSEFKSSKELEVSKLIDGVKIWNYDFYDYLVYTDSDFVSSGEFMFIGYGLF